MKRPSSMPRGRKIAGGWLVTYADLMTILVCFFVLIVSYSVQDRVKMEVVAGSMREAFGVAEERRYAGDIKLEGAPDQRQPGNVIPSATPTGDGLTQTLAADPAAGSQGRDAATDRASAERKQFEATRERIENAILTRPILRRASDTITIDLTERGLQVMLVDTAARPMFLTGGAEPTIEARALITEMAEALKPLANRITIEGHADASGAGSYSAFDLTADRANAARRLMEEAGLPTTRIAGVAGRGDADPLFPENPYATANRRIEIILEPAAPLLPEDGAL